MGAVGLGGTGDPIPDWGTPSPRLELEEVALAFPPMYAIFQMELNMCGTQAELPKKTVRPDALSGRFSRTLRATCLRVKSWLLFRDRLASSLGIDVRMVERYLQENEELRRKAEKDSIASPEPARATVPHKLAQLWAAANTRRSQ